MDVSFEGDQYREEGGGVWSSIYTGYEKKSFKVNHIFIVYP